MEDRFGNENKMADRLNTENDEFFPSEETNRNMEELTQRLNTFSYHFVENIELNLNFCLKLLQERTVEKKDNSLATNAIGLLLGAIPKIGKGLSEAIKQGELYLINKIDKKNCRNLANLVYFYNDNKDQIRQILIESANEIFYAFETQFLLITSNCGPLKAMQKLSIDAAYRIFDYLLENKQNSITIEEVTKGLVRGNSKRDNFGKRSGRTVKNPKAVNWKTSSIYEKCGLFFGNELQFSKTKNCKTEKYGYRRNFDWENSEEAELIQTEEISLICSDYILEKSGYADLLNQVKEYIIKKIPEENARFDRELKHNESMEDRGNKQTELLKTFEETHSEQLKCLEMNFMDILQAQENSKEIIEKIDKKQDIELENHTEIKEKLKEIHQDLITTKNDQATLIRTTETIKEEIKQTNETASTLALNPEPLKDLVEDIKDKLRKNDPGPAIHREFDRALKKVKKLW